jgi:hypothetical protein
VPVRSLSLNAFLLLSWAACLAACKQPEPPEFSFYDDRIAPVMNVGCVAQTTGCHVARADQSAVGNLDLSSFDALMRREDVIAPTGPYPVGQLLLKGGDPALVAVQTFDPPDPTRKDELFVALQTDIRHAGGVLLREGSDGYAAIKSWAAEGYTRGGEASYPVSASIGDCLPGAGAHVGFDADEKPVDKKSYDAFVDKVQPMLVRRCAGSSCHGTQVADLHLSCGQTEAESRWNYFVALAHVDLSVSLSELLRRPLTTERGGTYHEGGNVFIDTKDPDYRALRDWVEDVVERVPELVRYAPSDEGLRYFGNYVQPVFVKKGCMLQGCHSPAMFHDLRLRGGSQGVFSRIAFDRNYEMSRLLLATESEDPNQSRLIAKNLFHDKQGGRGMAHRGGALFEDFAGPADPSLCEDFDLAKPNLAEVSAYCVMVGWHALERRLALERGELAAAEQALLWVSRPTAVGDVRDFDTYRPRASLLRATLTLSDDAPVLGTPEDLLPGCGLSPAVADVRGPASSWDGKRIAFAARAADDEPLRIYTASADGSDCAKLADIAADKERVNGILTHDFDPTFAPDGRLVFASTRGHLAKGYQISGPTRTRSELRPNANLYVFDPKNRSVRELTFLNNQELMPSFMADGRVIFTTEKREPDFFQLAGRRINLDGGDYHPLFAQRKSVGFEMATEIVELANRNLALVAAPFGAKDGAGTIAIINRSIGPDQNDRDPKDRLYVHSLAFPAPGAFDKGQGAYRSPVALPSKHIILSCDPSATNLSKGGFDFDLCALDPVTGRLTMLGGQAGKADIEGVAIYARPNHGVFASRMDEANGSTRVDKDERDAVIQYNDFPLLATLLFSNTREGRPIDERVRGFDVLESLPPPIAAESFADLPAGKVVEDDYGKVFVDYDPLGHVALYDDGSAKVRVAGGHPLILRVTGKGESALEFAQDAPFEGEMVGREEIQVYPGERTRQSFRREQFNGLCGGCHGSITGYDLDVAVDIDALTHASQVQARDAKPSDLTR